MKKKLKEVRSTWYIWIFPLIALGICGWFYYQYLEQKGPTIWVYFDDATGIEAEKTKVRYRGVLVGTVKKITVSYQNEKKIVAKINLLKEYTDFATEGSRFWLVIPDVKLQGITGLETIFQGAYISAQPGPEDGQYKEEFKGQIGGESKDPLEDTTSYTLETSQVGSVGSGDAVTFRGVAVGTVTKSSLSKTAQLVNVQINIKKKYAHLVRSNTVFWRKMAVQANLGLFNSEIKLGAMDTLLHGGVELFTPDEPGPIAKPQTTFWLLEAPPKDWQTWNPSLEIKD